MKTAINIIKVLFQYSLVIVLGLFTVCMGFGVPETGDPEFVSNLLMSKLYAIAAGYVTYTLARAWNIFNINNEIDEKEVA